MRILWFVPVFIVALEAAAAPGNSSFTPPHLAHLKNRTRALFRHGWSAYMTHGFPADEVRPLSCKPFGPQYTRADSVENDAMGNVSSTLLDNLDSLLVMNEWAELESALRYLREHKIGFFHQNFVVQVFEASIRWLGGLLSVHLALTDLPWRNADPQIQDIVAHYDGFLLEMAYDLGLRLIPAYKTTSGLPMPLINLARGVKAVSSTRSREACTAGATTPFLELTLLSRLTGDSRFESVARAALERLWDSRSTLGLLPMSLDPVGDRWSDMVTGVGASVDSFYEHVLKGSILFGDDSLWQIFRQSYQALLAHSKHHVSGSGWTYFANVRTDTAERATQWIDSLSAFWPGLQVLAGRLSDAVASHLVFLKVWNHFDSLPERWGTMPIAPSKHAPTSDELVNNAVLLEWYPLRPEFIESTYYLYRATRDPMYLQIGSRILNLFESRFWAPCGFAGYQDIRSGLRQDRMETFVLGESLKYLYLLFDEANESYVHSDIMKTRNWVFSTEAHPLWYTKALGAKSARLFSKHLVPPEPPTSRVLSRKSSKHMWRGLLLSNEAIPKAQHKSLDGVTHFGFCLRPANQRFDTCEPSPIQWRPALEKKFLGSGYYEWNQLFSPEFSLNDTLVRPAHLAVHGEASAIELSEEFLNTYGLGGPLVCAENPTTKETDIIFGDLARPEEYEIYEVAKVQPGCPFALQDLVMPEIRGRARMEHLTAHSIDSNNTIITVKYLESVVPSESVSREDSDHEVLRITTLNGFELTAGTRIWTQSSYLEGNPETFRASPHGQVFLNEQLVENLMAY